MISPFDILNLVYRSCTGFKMWLYVLMSLIIAGKKGQSSSEGAVNLAYVCPEEDIQGIQEA